MQSRQRRPVSGEEKWTRLAAISGHDWIGVIHLGNALRSHGIDSFTLGSRGYGISVPAAKVRAASAILHQEARKFGIALYFSANDHTEELPYRTLIAQASMAATLKRPEFAPQTTLGRFLRCREITDGAVQNPYIERMLVRERRYLATLTRYSTGYDVQIELVPKLPTASDGPGLGYQFQVYDNGRSIDFWGSS